MSIAKRLKSLREQKNISQKQLADMTGLSQQAIYSVEKGISKGSPSIQKIAAALQSDPNWLLFGTVSADSFELPVLDWDSLITKEADSFENTARVTVSKQLCSKDSYFLRVANDAMIASSLGREQFLIGDFIGVDPKKIAQSGQYVIAQIRSKEPPLFRQYIKDGATTYLKAINTEYPAIKLTASAKILGVVFMRLNYLTEGENPKANK